MLHRASTNNVFLPIRLANRKRFKNTSWWAPIWRGLLVEPSGKHYHAMGTALWLYLYLIVHADRKAGTLFRRIRTIAKDMGISDSTVSRWMKKLTQEGYVSRASTGRALDITIERWKPLQ